MHVGPSHGSNYQVALFNKQGLVWLNFCIRVYVKHNQMSCYLKLVYLSIVRLIPSCPKIGELEMEYGLLVSPNFPNKYPNFQNCSWVLSVQTGSYVALKFQSFEVHLYIKILRAGHAQLKIVVDPSCGPQSTIYRIVLRIRRPL